MKNIIIASLSLLISFCAHNQVLAMDMSATGSPIERSRLKSTEVAQNPTTLTQAVRINDIESLKQLIANKADLEAKNKDGQTAVAIAAMMGRDGALHILLAAGANPNARDNDQFTPLMETACRGCSKCTSYPDKKNPLPLTCQSCFNNAQCLISAGADLNGKDHNGYTAVLYATGHQKWPIADLLLYHKARHDARECTGITSLHNATQYGSINTVQLLLANGASAEAPDNGDRTPYDLALKTRNHNLIDIFSVNIAQYSQKEIEVAKALLDMRTRQQENVKKEKQPYANNCGAGFRRYTSPLPTIHESKLRVLVGLKS
ncbi:MAG: ankyrin repeat domain-containing protein [Candidatus Dependentiae bacterium]|nr:ankyrin repeat domain-containing protein [Candidatus Dependentiae bacterium]